MINFLSPDFFSKKKKAEELVLKEEDIHENCPELFGGEVPTLKTVCFYPLHTMPRGKIYDDMIFPKMVLDGKETIILDKNSWYLKLWYQIHNIKQIIEQRSCKHKNWSYVWDQINDCGKKRCKNCNKIIDDDETK